MQRRACLVSMLGYLATAAVRAEGGAPSAPPASALGDTLASPPRALQFPRDFGAHPETRVEWWYVTGTLTPGEAAGKPADGRRWGFQITFFRTATGVATSNPSRFAATQLIFAHAALTDLQAGRLRHDQRIARSGFGIASADEADTHVSLRDWSLAREPRRAAAEAVHAASAGGEYDTSRYQARVASDSAGFQFDLQLSATQPLLLQGDAGFSRKGPEPTQFSRYYSQPQLQVQGRLTLEGRPMPVQGRAWLDHEWSDSLLGGQAIGWDWIGMNLDDGSALTAFRLRRADGSALYAGGSFRGGPLRPNQAVRSFGPDEVRFAPGRLWESAASKARYPVEWTVDTPVGRFTVKAMLDNQELDSRGSTGSIYWEGLSELFDARGQRVGRGYLELTGYASALRL